MIQNDQKWSKMIKLCENGGFKNYIYEMKIDQNHSKLIFSMVSINFYIVFVKIIHFENQHMNQIIKDFAGVKMRPSLY